MQLPQKYCVTWVVLVVCLFSIASCHRKVKPPRNYIGGLKQNFDRMCAKIATLEEKLNHQEEKLKDQEEELNDLKMQRDDRETQLSILEERVNKLEIEINITEYKSAFAIFGENPTEAASGVMTVPKEGVISNIGNNYNPTTGQYTAPYDGIYVFGLHIYKSEFATKTVVCSIRRNEQKVVAAYVPGVVELHEGSTAVVVHLNKNDIVDVGDCNDIDELENFTAFFGYLLKAD